MVIKLDTCYKLGICDVYQATAAHIWIRSKR